MPWRAPAFRELLAYVPTGDILLVPVGHTLLRGLLRPLLIYALRTKLVEIPEHNSVIFDGPARRAVKVRRAPRACVVYLYMRPAAPTRWCWRQQNRTPCSHGPA